MADNVTGFPDMYELLKGSVEYAHDDPDRFSHLADDPDHTQAEITISPVSHDGSVEYVQVNVHDYTGERPDITARLDDRSFDEHGHLADPGFREDIDPFG